MTWLVLNPPFMLGIEQAGTAAKDPVRQDSVVETAAFDSISKTTEDGHAKAESQQVQTSGTWTTVEAEKAAYANFAASQATEAASKEPVIRSAFAYRSNAVKDLWWPSKFLDEWVVKDDKEGMPPLSWRERVSIGSGFVEKASAAFWGKVERDEDLAYDSE